MARTAAEAAQIIEQAMQEAAMVTPGELLELGQLATTIVVTRTKQGLDADRRDFKPYTHSYARERARSGLSARPDLVRKGHMMGGFGPSVSGPDEVTLRFQSQHESNKADWTGKERSWFDVRDDLEISALSDLLGRNIVDRIEKILE